MFSKRTLGGVSLVMVLAGSTALAQSTGGRRDTSKEPGPHVATVPASQPDGKPSLQLDTTLFDFGTVWEGEPVAGVVTLKNVGDAPLTIKARSSCGCTVVSRPRSPLPPGESTTVDIKYRTDLPIENVRKRITFKTNDPVKQSYYVAVVGSVKRHFEFSPWDRVLFKDAPTDLAASQTIQLRNRYSEPIQLRPKAGQDYTPFRVEFRELEPGQLYEITATTIPPLQVGQNHVQLVLEPSLPQVPPLKVNLYANVPQLVTCMPPVLGVPGDSHQRSEQTIKLSCRAGTHVQFRDVQTTPASIACEILPPEEPGDALHPTVHRLRVLLPPVEELPDQGARITLTAEDPEAGTQAVDIAVMKQALRPMKAAPVEDDDSEEDSGPDDAGKSPTTRP